MHTIQYVCVGHRWNVGREPHLLAIRALLCPMCSLLVCPASVGMHHWPDGSLRKASPLSWVALTTTYHRQSCYNYSVAMARVRTQLSPRVMRKLSGQRI